MLHEFNEFKTVKRIIKIDTDLKILADVQELWTFFDKFHESNLIGLALEQSPVYRHVFSAFRSENKGTVAMCL